MTALWQDVRFAFRGFARNRGITAAIAISIALGIAANTTVFTMVNALLLGDLPVREPDRLVSFSDGNSFSWPDFLDFRAQTKSVFQDVSAHFPLVPASLGGGGEPERVWGQVADAAYFSMIGVPMQLGRGFSPQEDTLGRRAPVVVLSNSLWRRRFAADPAILGREVILNNGRYTVIGVTAPAFHGVSRGIASEFWLPLSLTDEIMPDLKAAELRGQRNAQWLCLTARLQPGVNRRQAYTALNAVKQRLDAQYRKDSKNRYATRPVTLDKAGGAPGLRSVFESASAVLMVIVGLVLLIACVNVASLLLARSTTRQREIAIRLSVGASRGRLVRQLLTESVLLSLLGTAVGLMLAFAATSVLSGFRLPVPMPVAFEFPIDFRVLAFTSLLGAVTGVLFGLAPALRATRPDLAGAIKNGTNPAAGPRRFGARGALVLVQVALSLVLLVCAGLFVRSLQNASSIDLGMRTDGIVMMAFDPKLHHYTPERTRQFVTELRRRVANVPGVASVSYVDSLPLSLGGTNYDFQPLGGTQAKGVNANVFTIGTGYFNTLGIPMRAGRDFTPQDTGKTVVINEEMARQAFGGSDPLGRQFERGGGPIGQRQVYEVIGVVRNSKARTLGEAPTPCAYLFLDPNPEGVMSFFGITILVRGAGTPAALEAAVRGEIHALDANLPVFNSETMQTHVDRSMLFPRLLAVLLGVFGIIGIVLATVGLYGVVSYAARARTREIGIRMALGATASSVLGTILRQGLILVGIGLAIGLALSLAISRFTASLLYGIGAKDPFTFIAVPLLMLAVGTVAVLIPARRAARIDPLNALRHD